MSGRTTTPRVSVGIPVYNGENYLGEAIESVLGQTLDDLEVVICDNASSDATAEIARAYAERDPRVIYHRNAENIGASRNYNLTFELSSGEYFKWLAHDDLIAPRCLELCVAELDRDATAVLCHSHMHIIDDTGRVIGRYTGNLSKADSNSASERFGDLVANDHRCTQIFGLFRSSVLRGTPLLGTYIASDRILRAELGMYGRFASIAEPLFCGREHPERSVNAMPSHHQRAAWFDPSRAGRTVLPHWRVWGEYARCVRRGPLHGPSRVRAYAHALAWPLRSDHTLRLAADLLIAVVPGSWKLLYRASGAATPYFDAADVDAGGAR